MGVFLGLRGLDLSVFGINMLVCVLRLVRKQLCTSTNLASNLHLSSHSTLSFSMISSLRRLSVWCLSVSSGLSFGCRICALWTCVLVASLILGAHVQTSKPECVTVSDRSGIRREGGSWWLGLAWWVADVELHALRQSPDVGLVSVEGVFWDIWECHLQYNQFV